MGSVSHHPTYDVVIIGAGLAGLTAAHTIHERAPHLSYLVLEARDRIGGKSLSTPRPDGKGKQELGAAWINDTNQSQMWALAQSLHLDTNQDEITTQNINGNVAVQDLHESVAENDIWGAGPGNIIHFPYGTVPDYADSGDTQDCVRVRDLVSATKDDPEMRRPGSQLRRDLDAMSFEEWLWMNEVGKRGRLTARVWTHAMLGVDPGEVSALYFLEYCSCGGGLMTMRGDGKNGGQYLRFKSGTTAFAHGLRDRLRLASVMLNKPVVEVSQIHDAVWITTRGGEKFCAKQVIVSIPTPVYRTIQWEPPLSPEKRGTADRTRYGCYTKYITLFSKPFWREEGFCGLSQSFLGPVSVTRDSSVDIEGNYAMTCFIGGVFARRWSSFDKTKKRDTVLKQLGDIYANGKDISDLCIDTMESPWNEEVYNGFGCPCPVLPPGCMEHGSGIEALRTSEGRLHFVGTETADVWRGYMEGAIRSGADGGLDAMRALEGNS